MITVMTKKEADSIINREVVRDSDIVITIGGDGGYSVYKNRFAVYQSKHISPAEFVELLIAYTKLVT